MSARAFSTVPCSSNERLASTSVDTRPGTSFKISQPKATASLSMNTPMRPAPAPFERSSAWSTRAR
jgi:hypothetical protein